jgi:hypothetical protein
MRPFTKLAAEALQKLANNPFTGMTPADRAREKATWEQIHKEQQEQAFKRQMSSPLGVYDPTGQGDLARQIRERYGAAYEKAMAAPSRAPAQQAPVAQAPVTHQAPSAATYAPAPVTHQAPSAAPHAPAPGISAAAKPGLMDKIRKLFRR